MNTGTVTGPLECLVGRLRDEAQAHQTVYEDDRRRKALFAEAADAIERMQADSDIGRLWRRDSSLETWFPFTALEIDRLRENTARMRAAIRQTLDENAHLADGDVCTLLALKRALPEWQGMADPDLPPNDEAQPTSAARRA